MILWLMAFLLPSTCQDVEKDPTDVPALIRKLNHDDPDVREAAARALRRAGSRAFPELEKALGHPSPEVRGRAATVLSAFPRYALKFLLDHPDFPELRCEWNAVIETTIAKRPIPAALWRKYGGMIEEEPAPQFRKEGSHEGSWIHSRLRESAPRAVLALAVHYGVEGIQQDLLQETFYNCRHGPLPGNLMARLVKCDADATAFEEIYATILKMYADHQAEWLACLSDEDWDTVLRFFVHLRRRPGEKPMVLPAGRDEALAFISRGPWVRGLADALGRALPNYQWSTVCRMEEAAPGRWNAAEQPPETKEAAAIYARLFRMDKMIKDRYFSPDYLSSDRPGLPDPKTWGKVHRDNLELAIGKLNVDEDTLRVLNAIVLSWHPAEAGYETKFMNDNFDDVTIHLIRALGNRVVEAVRAPPSPPK